MKNKRGRRFSYSDNKIKRYQMRRISLVVLVFLVFYFTFTSLLFSVRIMESNAMIPNLRAGERFVFSSYALYPFIPGFDEDALPLRRGNIVLVDMAYSPSTNVLYYIADGIVRLFTAQRVSLQLPSFPNASDSHFVKRVIALPGDEVSISNYVARIKPKDSAFSLTEFELTEKDYRTEIPHMPAIWDSSLPFSGDMDAIVLGKNEFFLLSDDRSSTNDSRTWGAVKARNIRGKALFRYYPFVRLGAP